MPRLNGVGGEKCFFFPNKDLGTRVGDLLGTGKYFPCLIASAYFCECNVLHMWAILAGQNCILCVQCACFAWFLVI